MEAYDGYRRQTEGMGDVFLLTDAYRKRLDEQQHEYDSLHTYFDQLSKSSDQLAQRTMGSMAAISNNLDSVSADLGAMHSSISSAQKAIISTRRNSVISKVLWASAGVLTGVLITTLIVK